jgi:succinoglycan biosynthesis protein ExoA
MPPKVSIIVPCLNEESTIAELLEAVRSQDFPLRELELLIADGGSEDGTLEVIGSYVRRHPELTVRIVENPQRRIPAALNRAIEASSGSYIIRLDAHSAPAEDYIMTCIKTLERTQAANVGGVWEIRPGASNWVGRSIAAAAAHPLGAGDARYRISGEAGPVDTVPFGAFRREWLERVGSFNEELLTNEDYEYNVRIRRAGGEVFFDPHIRSQYIARASFSDLARQYWRYGFWKLRMLRRFPATLRWRQALPPLFVLTGLMLAILAIFNSAARLLLAVQLGAYALIAVVFGVWEAIRRTDPGLVPGFPLALWTMHLAWGTGFLWSCLTGLRRDR